MRLIVISGGVILSLIAGIWLLGHESWERNLGLFAVVTCLAAAAMVVRLPAIAAICLFLAAISGLVIASETTWFIGWALVAGLLAVAAFLIERAQHRSNRHAAATDQWLRSQIEAMESDSGHRSRNQ